MDKKMGRPTDNPKNSIAKFRIDDDSKSKLEQCSRILNVSKSEILREGIRKVYGAL